MNRVLSQLVYHRVQSAGESPRVITLHDFDQFGGDVAEYGLAAAPYGRVIGLESYKGVYNWKRITGYRWFVGPNSEPSPVFFGDALGEIERFLWDEIDRQDADHAELPFLLGIGQGGIMALAAAAAVPDLLSGVIVIDGSLPIVPGWDPPLVPLDGLPLLVLDSNASRTAVGSELIGRDLAETYATWGATVERVAIPHGSVPISEIGAWMAKRKVRTRSFATGAAPSVG